MIEKDCYGFEPGSVMKIEKQGIIVSTKTNGLLLKKIHFQGSKPMDAYSFVIGHKMEEGYRFDVNEGSGKQK